MVASCKAVYVVQLLPWSPVIADEHLVDHYAIGRLEIFVLMCITYH